MTGWHDADDDCPDVPVAARCGYCQRRLDLADRGFECPRCGPLLRALPDGSGHEATLVAFRRFRADAWDDRERHTAAETGDTTDD